jgi:hypothetical protein
MPKLKGLVQLPTDIKGRWSIEAPPGAEVFSEEFQPEKLTLEKTLDIQGYSAKLYLKTILKFPLAVGEHAVWKIPSTLDGFPRVVSDENLDFYCIRFRPQKDYALIGGRDFSTGKYKLWRINPDGSGFTYLTTTPGSPDLIEWLEDGSKALVLVAGVGIHEYNPANNSLTLINDTLTARWRDIRRGSGNIFYISYSEYPNVRLLKYDYNTNSITVLGEAESGYSGGRIVIRSNPFRVCFISIKITSPNPGAYMNIYDGSSFTSTRFRDFVKDSASIFSMSGSLCDWDSEGNYLYLMLGMWVNLPPPNDIWNEVWRMSLSGEFEKVYETSEANADTNLYIHNGFRMAGNKFITVGGGLAWRAPSQHARYSAYWDGQWVMLWDETEPTSWACREADTV